MQEKSEIDTGIVRLTYFHGRGLGEKVRWMLAAAGIEFEQSALSTHDEFLEFRDSGKLLFKQLPLLEIDGLNLTQHRSMYRYVAERGNLYGSSSAVKAAVDMVCEFVHDLSYTGYAFRAGQEAKEEYLKGMKESLTKKIPILEEVLSTNPAFTREDITADNLLASDVLIAEVLTAFQEYLGESVLDEWPVTKNLVVKVRELPSIQAYLQSEKRYPCPKDQVGDDYKKNVDTVLGR